MSMLKVCFHISKLEEWTVAVKNINNFINDISGESEYDIRVVANSAGVLILTSDLRGELENLMKDLSGKGVMFEFCNNALNFYKIDTGLVFNWAKVVRAGITEIVKLQDLGFTYIKP
ncbi:DsrE family protein [Thermodesulfobium sp. 4217-1]|uniref:DsrE family protein n=1 Tax=Thermodesulfobium sp. 4217-1 TaxID=3120013 RepID=UPI0032217A35